jgi:hypothetical protein
MIVRPLVTQLVTQPVTQTGSAPPPTPTPITAARHSLGPGPAGSRVRLNLGVRRLNIDGLSRSEQGIFLAAFQAQLNTLAQRDLQRGQCLRLADTMHTAAIRRIDGGVTPPRMDARNMGERAATAIFGALLRVTISANTTRQAVHSGDTDRA